MNEARNINDEIIYAVTNELLTTNTKCKNYNFINFKIYKKNNSCLTDRLLKQCQVL